MCRSLYRFYTSMLAHVLQGICQSLKLTIHKQKLASLMTPYSPYSTQVDTTRSTLLAIMHHFGAFVEFFLVEKNSRSKQGVSRMTDVAKIFGISAVCCKTYANFIIRNFLAQHSGMLPGAAFAEIRFFHTNHTVNLNLIKFYSNLRKPCPGQLFLGEPLSVGGSFSLRRRFANKVSCSFEFGDSIRVNI